MPYTTQTWENDVSALSADRLNHMETGIADAHTEILPAGSIVQYAGSSAPTGYLLCDGQSYLRADYNALFTAIGGTGSPWGLPDGTHFNVPDLRGRIPVGLGTHADVDTLAENDGSTIDNRRPKHNHTMNESAHTHPLSNVPVSGTGQAASSGGWDYGSSNTGEAVTGITVGPQTNAPTDAPSYVVVNYIIKT